VFTIPKVFGSEHSLFLYRKCVFWNIQLFFLWRKKNSILLKKHFSSCKFSPMKPQTNPFRSCQINEIQLSDFEILAKFIRAFMRCNRSSVCKTEEEKWSTNLILCKLSGYSKTSITRSSPALSQGGKVKPSTTENLDKNILVRPVAGWKSETVNNWKPR